MINTKLNQSILHVNKKTAKCLRKSEKYGFLRFLSKKDFINHVVEIFFCCNLLMSSPRFYGTSNIAPLISLRIFDRVLYFLVFSG